MQSVSVDFDHSNWVCVDAGLLAKERLPAKFLQSRGFAFCMVAGTRRRQEWGIVPCHCCDFHVRGAGLACAIKRKKTRMQKTIRSQPQGEALTCYVIASGGRSASCFESWCFYCTLHAVARQHQAFFPFGAGLRDGLAQGHVLERAAQSESF